MKELTEPADCPVRGLDPEGADAYVRRWGYQDIRGVVMDKIATRARAARARLRNETVEQAAAAMGVTVDAVERLERGDTSIPLEVFLRFLQYRKRCELLPTILEDVDNETLSAALKEVERRRRSARERRGDGAQDQGGEISFF